MKFRICVQHLDELSIFVGRNDIFQAIESSLYAPQGKPTLVVHGPRRVGKTAVLLHLPRLLPTEIIPAFVDMQGIGVSSEGSFYFALVKEVVKAAQHHRDLALPAPELSMFTGEPTLALATWLDQVEAILGDRPLLLAIDEFEKLGRAIDEGRLPMQILDTLRHLIQHRPKLYLLFAGVSTLAELGPRWHDYFISVRPLRVSYLDEQSTRHLIERPLPDWPLQITSAASGTIIPLTRCQPYLVQLVCSELVAWHNSKKRRRLPDPLTTKTNDVKEAAQRALQSGEPYFTNLWEDAGEAGREALATASSPDGTKLPSHIPTEVIERLLRLDLLEEENGVFRIQVELTRSWIVKRSGRSQ